MVSLYSARFARRNWPTFTAPARSEIPPGLEVKYFTTALSGALQYGQMAQARFGDGPYTVVATAISPSLIQRSWIVHVHSGIEALTLPTSVLYHLAPPTVVQEA